MAVWYVRSGAAGTGSGADWTNAYTTLKAAAEAAGTAAGDTLYVSDDHAETQASALTITFKGTAAAPTPVIAVNHSGTVPPVAADITTPGTQASVSTTGANAITLNGHAWIYNILFSCASAANAATITIGATGAHGMTFVNCLLKLNTTAASQLVTLGSGVTGTSHIRLVNTPIQFGAATQGVRINTVKFTWLNTASAIAGTVPTTLFGTTSQKSQIFLEGVDLSALVGASTLFGNMASMCRVDVKDCKLSASLSAVAAAQTAGPGAGEIVITRTASSGNYNLARYNYMGVQTTDTSVYRTGGASDGTTSVGWKIIPTANCKWIEPFECLPIAVWNDTITSTITLTLYGGYSVGVPNNDDIWFDVVCLDTAGNPQGGFHSNTKTTILTAASAQTADASTWNASPGTKFSMAQTITAPAQKGLIYLYVKVGAATGTFYIDPKVVVS